MLTKQSILVANINSDDSKKVSLVLYKMVRQFLQAAGSTALRTFTADSVPMRTLSSWYSTLEYPFTLVVVIEDFERFDNVILGDFIQIIR